MTQEDLAAATDVSIGAVRNWEQGHRLPHFEAAYRISKALGITLDELAGKVFEETPPPKKRPAARPKGKGKKPAKGSDTP
jgi:transcriptional regulator with XRE-family HTH domain